MPAAAVRLEQRLVLLKWALSLFGADDVKTLLGWCRNEDEGFDDDGVFRVTRVLAGHAADADLRKALMHYDLNLRRHLERINRARAAQPLELRYFQVLALLFTELYLDRLAQGQGALLDALNRYLAKENARLAEALRCAPFGIDDLRKLAFWMATGSGKTLLLHFNLLQYRDYFPGPLNNILLITPNEGLSAQHIAEARASGLQVERFDPERPGLLPGDVLQVIEITKLVEDKKGGGVTVPVSRFRRAGVPNLVFVDEGHKGSSGEVWKGYRDQLGETGFTFEYSATFGQALNAAGSDPLTEEYGKAILFDYSYRYFHDDGFGKDFRLFNVDSDDDTVRHQLMAANLLAYYQQLRVFDANPGDWARYGIEKPLWVFVGASVNSGKKGGSDIVAVLDFLHGFMANRRSESVKTLKKLLHDRRLFRDQDGNSALGDAFDWLRREYPESSDFDALFADVLRRVFQLDAAGGGLELRPIRGADGEIALHAQGAQSPFGLVYVGDAANLLKLVQEDGKVPVLDDVVGDSLFAGITRPGSTVNLLIGAKKFIEGWSSWRVSSLGLLNVGKSEGSQIIQLFGRGVRLLGLGRRMKRSTAIAGEDHPADIAILERLNVFSVRAKYMATFRESLLREGVEDVVSVVFTLDLFRLQDKGVSDLVYFQPPAPARFREEVVVRLQPQPSLQKVRLDLSARFAGLASTGDEYADSHAARPAARPLSQEQLALVDWTQCYARLLEKKRLRGWSNAIVRPERLQEVVGQECEFIADDAFFDLALPGAERRLNEAVSEALEAWFERRYRLEQNRYESRNMRATHVAEAQAQYPPYRVQVRADEAAIIDEIGKLAALLERGEEPDWNSLTTLARVKFPRHLYQPLLVAAEGKVLLSPKGLEKSEVEFVEALREYWERERNATLQEKKVFLLRNQGRGKGVGFYESAGFFPDFILWVVDGNAQRIVFIEPHGLLQENQSSDKINGFHERLREYVAKGLHDSGRKGIEVDGWVISATEQSKLIERWGADWDAARLRSEHILFPQTGYGHVLQTILAEPT